MLEQGVVLVNGRRRSVDVGGLSLAISGKGLGNGWGGWEEREKGEISYAELLSEMYNQTVHTVNERHGELPANSLPDHARHRLIDSLDTWNFEPHKLPEEEVLSCTLILFEALFRMEGMKECVGVSLNQILAFIRHLRQIYRVQNSYHNFRHALDVLQATHTFLHSAGRVPSVSILRESDDRMWRPDKIPPNAMISCLSNEDIFTLYIAAIGHDVGHPGFTNVFMKNAKTPLSAVYDDQSALEQMHLAILLRVMRRDALGPLLDRPGSGTTFRRLLCDTILSTDMSVHWTFMDHFKSLIDGDVPGFEERKILVCQALLKCADISNSSRPHRVSQYWATALMDEWNSQACLEKYFQLPASVQPSGDPLSGAKCQVFFINTFAKPLFDLVAQAIPELSEFADHCSSNLNLWQTRCSQLTSEPVEDSKDLGSPCPLPPPPSCPQLVDDFMDAFPLSLPPSFMSLTPHEEHPPPMTWPSIPSRRSSSSSSSDDVSSSTSSDANPAEDDTTVHSGSPPLSPSESISSPMSSRSEFSSSVAPLGGANAVSAAASVGGGRPPSSASMCSSGNTNEASAVMRAAYQKSVRRKKSCYNRNSWTVVDLGDGFSISGMLARGASTPPPPPPPLPSLAVPSPPSGLSVTTATC